MLTSLPSPTPHLYAVRAPHCLHVFRGKGHVPLLRHFKLLGHYRGTLGFGHGVVADARPMAPAHRLHPVQLLHGGPAPGHLQSIVGGHLTRGMHETIGGHLTRRMHATIRTRAVSLRASSALKKEMRQIKAHTQQCTCVRGCIQGGDERRGKRVRWRTKKPYCVKRSPPWKLRALLVSTFSSPFQPPHSSLWNRSTVARLSPQRCGPTRLLTRGRSPSPATLARSNVEVTDGSSNYRALQSKRTDVWVYTHITINYFSSVRIHQNTLIDSTM